MRSGSFFVRKEKPVTIRREKCNRSVTFSHRAVMAESQGGNKKVTVIPATGSLSGAAVTMW